MCDKKSFQDIPVKKPDDLYAEYEKRIKSKDGFYIRRAPGTCCPEPSCDYTSHDGVKCQMCGKVCDGCGRKKQRESKEMEFIEATMR